MSLQSEQRVGEASYSFLSVLVTPDLSVLVSHSMSLVHISHPFRRRKSAMWILAPHFIDTFRRALNAISAVSYSDATKCHTGDFLP